MSEHKVNGSEGAREGGLGHDILKKNRNFYIGVGGTVLEGMLSGSLFMLLYLCHAVSVVRTVRHESGIDIDWCNCGHFPASYSDYSYGYTKAQIGGAEVSKNIRLFMGDHLKTYSAVPVYPGTDRRLY